MTPEAEVVLKQLMQLLWSADGTGYEITVVLNVLVLERLTPPKRVQSMNDMMGLDLRKLAPLAEALAAGVDKGFIEVTAPGLVEGESLTYFEDGRKRMDLVKLVRLSDEARREQRDGPLVNYAPGNNPFAADFKRPSQG